MKIRNQSGFAAVEALLIVIILGLIGGAGYYVWHAKQASDKTLTDSTQASSSAVENYYDCYDKMQPHIQLDKSTTCVYDGKSYTLPSSFTTAMVRGYAKLPSSARPTVEAMAKDYFKISSADHGDGHHYVGEVIVNGVQANAFVGLTEDGFADTSKTVLKNDNGKWTSVLSVPAGAFAKCADVQKYNIPATLLAQMGVKTDCSNAASTTQHQNYLTIKEWGVSAPYKGPLSLSYSVDSSGNAEFLSKQIDDLVAGSDVSCKGYAGAIMRYTTTQHLGNDSSQPTAGEAGLTHVGSYYYQFVHAQAACEGPAPSTLSSVQQKQLSTLLAEANDEVRGMVPSLQLTSTH